MANIDTRLQQLIEATENRFHRSKPKRDRLSVEMEKAARGGMPDWQALDQRARYARRLERLGMVAAAEAVIDETDSAFNPLERILGVNELTGIAFVERALIAARAVARVEIRDRIGRLLGFGSGVLVSPRLLMTNNHVLGDAAEAANSVAQFEHLVSADGINMDARTFRFQPGVFFRTHEELDFTLVAVEPVNRVGDGLRTRGWCPLIAGSGKAVIGERVNIIQHPGGERMQITVRDNMIVTLVDDFLQYKADTKPGSSGSGVFNEQWELAALHHAGVPARDGQNRILLQDGSVWSGRREDLHKIKWVANEGTRISSIVKHVETLALTASERTLWQEALTVPPLPNIWELFRDGTSVSGSEVASEPGDALQGPIDQNGAASWLFRLSFGPVDTVQPFAPNASFGSSTTHSPADPSAIDVINSSASDAVPAGQPRVDASVPRLAEQIFERFRHDSPYYDADADSAARDLYWRGVDLSLPADDLATHLKHHLEETHTERHSYATARHKFLYPAIDVRKDGTLKNVYSGSVLDPREAISRELAMVLPRAEALGFETAGIDLERLLGDDELWEAVEEEALIREAASSFNCEHVVCQSWFDRRQPMKADLHHLFTCEPGCNSFRSNIPYWAFEPTDEAERDLCGRREGNKFEPEFGHGPVARATMYFLMRYPGELGDRRSELTKNRVPVLMKWHETDPPGEYEKHRNWLTETAQGNRNPFIDFPGLATAALLTQGFAKS